MKLSFTCMLVAACTTIPAFAASSDTVAQEVFRRLSPSVVTVLALDENGGREGQGSGVVIARGQVVTNCHVVQEAATLRVVTTQGEMAARWIRRHGERDICLLAVEGLQAEPVALRSSRSLAAGEPVFALGNPLGFGLTISAGLIANFSTMGDTAIVLTTAAQSPGSSGGGLFDGDGRLVGITTAVLGTGQNFNLAIASDGLDSLAAKGLPPPTELPPPAPERRWEEEAVALQRASEWQKLEVLATEWAKAMPTAASPPTFLGLAQHALKRYPAAIATLERALALDEQLSFAWLNYGLALRDGGRPEDAEKALARAERIFPNFAEPSAIRASWLLQQGRHDDARREAQRSLRLDPGRAWVWRTLGLIEDGRGDGAAALLAYRTAMRLGDSSSEVAQKVARKLADAGNPDAASTAIAQVASGQREGALAEVAIGNAELQRNRLGPAESAMRKAIALAPGLADGWNGLAVVLARSGRHKETEQAIDQALKIQPDNLEFLTNRAITRRELGNRVGSTEDVKRVLSINPEHAPALRLQATLLLDTRNFREAVAVLSKLDSKGVATVGDLINLGDGLAEIGNFSESLKVLGRAEAKDGASVPLCLSKAKALGRSGDLANAVVYLDRALKQDATNNNAWSSKGYALLKLGRLPEAVETLETAVRLSPDFANAWINLGEAQMRSRNLGRAIPSLERAIQLAPAAMDARLYLAQSYLAARLPAKSREQAEWLIARKSDFVPAHAVQTLAWLLEGNSASASQSYLRMKALAPAAAQALRAQAIAAGMSQASGWPD